MYNKQRQYSKNISTPSSQNHLTVYCTVCTVYAQCACAMPRAQKAQQNVQMLYKTRVLFPSRSYYSMYNIYILAWAAVTASWPKTRRKSVANIFTCINLVYNVTQHVCTSIRYHILLKKIYLARTS